MEIAALIVGFAFCVHLLVLWILHMKKDSHYNLNIALHGGRMVGEQPEKADTSLLYLSGSDVDTVLIEGAKPLVTSSFPSIQIRLYDYQSGLCYDSSLRDQLVVGRYLQGSTAQIQLPDMLVSQKHCRIYRQGEQVYVQDLGSVNRTYVNGCAVEGTVPLMYGDQLKIGGKEYQFQCYV